MDSILAASTIYVSNPSDTHLERSAEVAHIQYANSFPEQYESDSEPD